MMEGFDHFTTEANVRRKWDTNCDGYGNNAGRFGGNAGGISFTGNGLSLRQGQLSAVRTRIVGFAFKPGGAAYFCLNFWDSGTVQASFRMNSSTMQAMVTRGGNQNDGAATLATSTQAFVAGTWYWVEVKMTVGTTDGAAIIRVNDVNWLNLSAVNTQTTANNTHNGISFTAANPTGMVLDDVYILNTSGSVNNDFLGESRVFTQLPAGDSGIHAQWTPSTGTAHYASVDENNPNDDTDYNFASIMANTDAYTFPAISSPGVVAGVQTVFTVRKDDAGTRLVGEVCRSGGTTYDFGVSYAVNASYLMPRFLRETDPATGTAWTLAGVNAAQFGARVIG
jgi:hypothetical protein